MTIEDQKEFKAKLLELSSMTKTIAVASDVRTFDWHGAGTNLINCLEVLIAALEFSTRRNQELNANNAEGYRRAMMGR